MRAVRFTVMTPECVRIESSRSGRFEDAPTLFTSTRSDRVRSQGQRPRVVPAEAGSPEFVIETGRLRLVFRPDGEPPSERNLRVAIRGGDGGGPGSVFGEWWPGKRQTGNLGGTLSTLDQIRGPVELDDGLLSRDGWYLLDDSKSPLLVDGWVRARGSESAADGDTDWYLFAYGDDYRAALRALAEVSGPVPMPRRAALGSWYSRYWPYTSEEYRGIVAEYREHGFPLDVMVFDMDWHRQGWTGWSWNRELLPDAEELLAWMHEQGLAVTLNLHPADGVGPHEDRYADFMRALGEDPGSGRTVAFDAGDRRYIGALFDEVHAPLEGSHRTDAAGRPVGGVDFWWLDWQQEPYVRSVPGLTNLRWLNRLYFEHTSRHGRRGLSFSRWAGWGDHRYPIHFSGDSHTGWPLLAFAVPFTSTAGNIGCFYWSHDVGGHFGPRLEETTARWVQFGALSPALRLHSARRPTLDRRPWTYEPRFRDSMRAAFRLRSELMPYVYTAAWQGTHDTLPLLRPMYLDHSREARAYRVGQQYLFGSDLLAAPIASPGLGERCVSSQEVWFPTAAAAGAGDDPGVWYRWGTSERYAGGAEAVVTADIDEVPLFARGGVPIPLRPPTDRMATAPLETLVLRLWPGADGAVHESSLYEDDGVSSAYQSGARAETAFVARWSREPSGAVHAAIDVGPAVGRFEGQVLRRRVRVEIAGVGVALGASVDGAPVPPGFDAAESGGTMTVEVPERDVGSPVRVEARFEPADSAAIEAGHRRRRFEAAFGPLGRGESVRAATIDRATAAHNPEQSGRVLAVGAGLSLVGDGPDVRMIDTLGWIDGGRIEAEVVDRFGAREAVLSRTELTLARAASGLPTDGPLGGAATIPLPRDGPARPPVGVRSSRVVRAHFTVDARPLVCERVARTLLEPIAPWLITGPFRYEWWRPIADQVAPPETTPFNPAARFTGLDGEPAAWKPGVPGPRWALDFRVAYPGRNAAAYAVARVISTRTQHSRLVVESSAKVEAWLNGRRVFSLDANDQPDVVAPSAEITLLQGPNLLMVKSADGGGGWGFTAYLDGPHEVSVDPIGAEQAAVPTAG